MDKVFLQAPLNLYSHRFLHILLIHHLAFIYHHWAIVRTHSPVPASATVKILAGRSEHYFMKGSQICIAGTCSAFTDYELSTLAVYAPPLFPLLQLSHHLTETHQAVP